jgi:hypothetical protein
MSRRRIGVAAAVAVVLFAMSPAFQGYHIGHSSNDTTCVTRFAIQFCKDEHARLAREQTAAEARTAQHEAAVAAQECRAIAKEAEEGKRTLNAGNYYLSCLRPGVNKQALIRKWEAQGRKELEQEHAQSAHRRAQLEAAAASLKQRAKRLTEEEERLDHEGKFSLGSEKSQESASMKQEAEKKLEEAKEVGG